MNRTNFEKAVTTKAPKTLEEQSKGRKLNKTKRGTSAKRSWNEDELYYV